MSWEPACTAPWNKEVIVRGDNEYTSMPNFVIKAIRTYDRMTWVDATGTPLTDKGWVPEWWWKPSKNC